MSNFFDKMGDDGGFLTADKEYLQLVGANSYNYTQAKHNAGGDTSWTPGMQIFAFCIVGFVISCCCIVCICMIVGGDENVSDLFKDDGRQ